MTVYVVREQNKQTNKNSIMVFETVEMLQKYHPEVKYLGLYKESSFTRRTSSSSPDIVTVTPTTIIRQET